MENDKPEEEKMSLISHLEELKSRLIRVLIAVGIGFVVCYLFKEWSFRVITKPLVAAMPAQNSLIFTGLPEAFFIHMLFMAEDDYRRVLGSKGYVTSPDLFGKSGVRQNEAVQNNENQSLFHKVIPPGIEYLIQLGFFG